MTDRLNSDTQDRMRDLCKKISVAHDLDTDIQEELFGHMEDKLLAYLNGEEPLTEHDALILVREHFGDPSVLKGLLQDVHIQEVHESLARRLAAACVVSTCGVMTFYAVWASMICLDAHIHPWIWEAFMGRRGVPSSIYTLISIASLAALGLVPWIVLCRWDRRSGDGQPLWFMRWRPIAIAGLVAALFFVQAVVQIVDGGEALDRMCRAWGNGDPVEFTLCGLVMVVCPASVCLAWLWWCDRQPRSFRTAAKTVSVWLVWFALCWVRIDINGMRGAEPSLTSVYALQMFVGYVIPIVFFTIVTALLACSLYAITIRIVRHRTLFDLR